MTIRSLEKIGMTVLRGMWYAFYTVGRWAVGIGFILAVVGGLLALRLSYGPVSLTLFVPILTALLGEEEIHCGELSLAWEPKEAQLAVTACEVVAPLCRVPRGVAKFSVQRLLRGRWKPTELILYTPTVILQVDPSPKDSGNFKLPLGWKNVHIHIQDAVVQLKTTQRLFSYARIQLQWYANFLRLWQTPSSKEKNDSAVDMTCKYTIEKNKTIKFIWTINRLDMALQNLWPELRGIVSFAGKIQGWTHPGFSSWAVEGAVHQRVSSVVGIPPSPQMSTIQNLRFSGHWTPESLVLESGKMQLNTAHFTWSVRGDRLLNIPEERWKFRIEAGLQKGVLSVTALPGIWPPFTGENARSWILENFHKGNISKAEGVLDMTWSLSEGTLVKEFKGKLGIRKIVLSFMPGIPSITELEATSDVDLKKFDIRILSGQFEGQKITQGRIVIAPLVGMTAMDLKLRLEGPIGRVLQVLNCPRLRYLKDVPLDFKAVKGRWVAHLGCSFPLLMDLRFKDIKLSLQGKLQNLAFGLHFLGAPISVSEGALDLNLDETKMALGGKSLVQRLPLTWQWKQRFHTPGSGSLSLKSSGTWGQWEKIAGISLKDFVQGPCSVSGTYFPSKDAKQVLLNVDLHKSQVKIPWIHWSKATNKPLRAKVTVSLGSSGDASKKIEVQTEGALWGAITLGLTPANAVHQINVQLRPNRASQVASHGYTLAYSQTPKQGYSLKFKGPYVDLSSLLSAPKSASDTPKSNPKTAPKIQNPKPICVSKALPSKSKIIAPKIPVQLSEKPFVLDIACNTCLLADGALTALKGKIWGKVRGKALEWPGLDAIRWVGGEVSGQLWKKPSSPNSNAKSNDKSSGSRLNLKITPLKSGETSMVLVSADVGSLFSSLGVAQKMEGGEGTLSVVQKDYGMYVGKFNIANIKVHTPYLLKLLALISPTAPLELFSRKLMFSVVRGTFHYRAGRLWVHKSVAQGVNLGIFVEGCLDLTKNRMNLEGVLIPAYWFNTFFQYVPIVGWLLGGDKGIVSTEFGVKGPWDDPSISVRPFSIFKIGFLRTIFDLLDSDGDSDSGPDNKPLPAQDIKTLKAHRER